MQPDRGTWNNKRILHGAHVQTYKSTHLQAHWHTCSYSAQTIFGLACLWPHASFTRRCTQACQEHERAPAHHCNPKALALRNL